MAYPSRNTSCVLLALLLAFAAFLVPPAACRTFKWVPFTSIASFMWANSAIDSLELVQSGPKPGTATSPVAGESTHFLLRGTLNVPSPAGDGSSVRRIQLLGSEIVPGTKPPATASLTTPSYTSQPASTTMTAKLQAMPAEGCVQEFPSGAQACVPVLVDLDWAAKGVRVQSYDTEFHWVRLTHDTKPPKREGHANKGVGADYTSSTALYVRVVKAESKEELFSGTIPCNNTTDSCMFSVSQTVGRVNAPV